MKRIKNPVCWLAVFALWALGAVFLLEVWNYQKALTDPLGSYVEFSVKFFVTFYLLALLPIKRCVNWIVSRSGFFEDRDDRSFSQ